MKTLNNKTSNELTVKSKTENLSLIREFVCDAAKGAGFDQLTADKIILAVDEACTNIIKHAYKYYPDGTILVKVKISGTTFIVEIVDHGNAFKPNSVTTPDIEEYYKQHKIGGLGMYLMKTLMDDVKYNSIPGKYNKVKLSKKIISAA
ncbi:MAG: ATP-binding protein [Bacteroidota bacterium]|nr:ATP-binding protein [Bacteroidota bacterium]